MAIVTNIIIIIIIILLLLPFFSLSLPLILLLLLLLQGLDLRNEKWIVFYDTLWQSDSPLRIIYIYNVSKQGNFCLKKWWGPKKVFFAKSDSLISQSDSQYCE